MALSTLVRWPALVGMVVGAGAMLGCYPPGVTETRSSTAPAVASKPIHVRSVNGAINVKKGTDSSVSIGATIHAENEERLKATQIIAERLSDGTLDVHVKWPDDKPKGDEGVSFEIALPDARDIKIETSNGPISVAGMSGEANLDTSNGSITVTSQDGPVKAHSSNASIAVSDATGSVAAESSNGGVSVKNGVGAIMVAASNGAIDVVMRPDAQGPVHLNTTNARIKLAIGASFAGVLKASTSNGSVSVRGVDAAQVTLARSSATVRLGDSKAESIVDTCNASIEITRQ